MKLPLAAVLMILAVQQTDVPGRRSHGQRRGREVAPLPVMDRGSARRATGQGSA